jgi:Flp pilus assembly pilin Flp
LNSITRFFGQFWFDDAAQDLVEYSLLAGFIAVAAGAFIPNIADSVNIIFSKVVSHLSRVNTF